MKILFSDNNLNSLINFRQEVIKSFLDQGHEVALVYPSVSSEYATGQEILKQCSCYPVDMMPSGMNVISDIKYICQLYNIYRRVSPDIAFHYSIKPNIYGSILCRLIRIKSVAMVAGLGYMFTGKNIGKKLGRLLYKIGLRSADFVISLNSSNYQTLLDGNYIKPHRSTVFSGGEGVDMLKYQYKESMFKQTRFLMIARVLYDKGYREYVDAAAIVKDEFPNVQIDLLGSLDESSPMGVPAQILKKDVHDGKINYLGVSNDVRQYVLQDGVVIVLPSYHEGLSRSLMEACAMGRPAIASNIPGCKETIDEGVNGFLVPPKDAIALAKAMKKFIMLTEDEKKAMSIAAYNKAKKEFDIKKVLVKYQEIISILMGE